MTASSLGYKYPLSALEALYAYRLEQARQVLASALRKFAVHQARIQELRSALNRCHEEWTVASDRINQFDPARHTAVREALASRQAALTAALDAESALLAEVERCREAVSRAYRQTETVARHKAQSMREHAQEFARIQQREADAAWPVRGIRL